MEHFSPFLEYSVLKSLVKKCAKTVNDLKILRKLSKASNSICLIELEECGLKGELKAIDLGCNSQENTENILDQFLEDTRRIRKLFTRFNLSFPESLMLPNLSVLLTDYSIHYLRLVLPIDLIIKDDVERLLRKFLGSMSSTLVEISGDMSKMNQNARLPFLYLPSTVGKDIAFPNLTVLDLGSSWRIIVDQLKNKIFDDWKGVPNVTALHLKSFYDIGISDLKGLLDVNLIESGRWSTLTKFHIFSVEERVISQLTSTLLDLARSGMKLQSFGIGISLFEIVPDFEGMCGKWSKFFATQADTLMSLKFDLHYAMDDEESIPNTARITLPIFPKLWNLQLQLDMDFRSPDNFLVLTCPNANFPKLTTLEVNSKAFQSIFFYSWRGNPINLHRLTLVNWEYPLSSINVLKEAKIRRVEVLECDSHMIFQGILHCPWSTFIRELILHIQQIWAPLRLTRLKCLNTLVINWEKEPTRRCLKYFRCISHTRTLAYLKFKGMKVDQEVKDAFYRLFYKHRIGIVFNDDKGSDIFYR